MKKYVLQKIQSLDFGVIGVRFDFSDDVVNIAALATTLISRDFELMRRNLGVVSLKKLINDRVECLEFLEALDFEIPIVS